MSRQPFLVCLCVLVFSGNSFAQSSAVSPAGAVWNALSAPTPDSSKSAHAENVVISRDRIHITLVDGTIQFMQPVNGIPFGTVFHGKGRVQVDPPNSIEERNSQRQR